MLEFFQQLPYHSMELSLIGKKGFHINSEGMLDITPVYDNDFLPKSIDELRRESPHKFVLTGICKYESLLFS